MKIILISLFLLILTPPAVFSRVVINDGNNVRVDSLDGEDNVSAFIRENLDNGAFIITEIAAGDVDKDGDLDIVAGNIDGISRLYINEGEDGFVGKDISDETHESYPGMIFFSRNLTIDVSGLPDRLKTNSAQGDVMFSPPAKFDANGLPGSVFFESQDNGIIAPRVIEDTETNSFYLLTGWFGTGDVPDTGQPETELTNIDDVQKVLIINDSSITWVYEKADTLETAYFETKTDQKELEDNKVLSRNMKAGTKTSTTGILNLPAGSADVDTSVQPLTMDAPVSSIAPGDKVLTIYFLGTGETEDWGYSGSDFVDPELVASLYRYDTSESDLLESEESHFRLIINGINGFGTGVAVDYLSFGTPDLALGRDWNACLADAKKGLDKVLYNKGSANQMILNLVGYSRGGILCMKMARKVEEEYPDSNIIINILAYEPVPGINDRYLQGTIKKLGNDVNLPARVKQYIGIYASDERSYKFEPVIPKIEPDTKQWLVRLRGSHETIVGSEQMDGHAVSTWPPDFNLSGSTSLGEIFHPGLESVGNISKAIAQELLMSPAWGGVDFNPAWEWSQSANKKEKFTGFINAMNAYIFYGLMRYVYYTPGGYSVGYDDISLWGIQKLLGPEWIYKATNDRLCFVAPKSGINPLSINKNRVYWLKNKTEAINVGNSWEILQQLCRDGFPDPIANAGRDVIIPQKEQADTILMGTASSASEPNNEGVQYRWILNETTDLTEWMDANPDGSAPLDLSTLLPFSIGNYNLKIEVTYSNDTFEDEMELWVVEEGVMYVDKDFNSNTDGWGVTRFNKIQNAINTAELDESDPKPIPKIHVFAGTYTEHLIIKEDVYLTGEGSDVVTISGYESDPDDAPEDGQGNKYGGVIYCENLGVETFIQGFKITKGTGYIKQNSTAVTPKGGGIYLKNCDLVLIKDCHIVENKAYDGGGIHNASSRIHIVNCLIENNEANGSLGHGGGVYNIDSPPMIENCIFKNNSATQYGGGMYNAPLEPETIPTFPGWEPTVINTYFIGNTAKNGGGVYNWDGSDLYINCTFDNNQANEGGGGGLYTYLGTPRYEKCTFFNNQSTGSGGAIFCNDSSPVIKQCLFRSNNSPAYITNSAQPHFINCVFDRNRGTSLLITGEDSHPTLTNCTLYGSNYFGIDTDSSGSFTLENTILWENTGKDIVSLPDSAIINNCNIQKVGTWTGINNNISQDPQFISGEGGNFRLLPTSPCIDQGNNDYLLETDIGDFYEKSRITPLEGIVDIGATESVCRNNSSDFPETDGDVDGADLAFFINQSPSIPLETFAQNFGRTDLDGLGCNGLDEGLVLYYPFDGNVKDASGNNRHGIIFEGPSGKNESGPVPADDRNGRTSFAYNFDGSDDHIDSVQFEQSNTFSISMWVNPNNPESAEKFIGKHTCEGGNILILGIHPEQDDDNDETEEQNEYVIWLSGGGQYSGVKATTGWQHFVVVVEAVNTSTSNFTLYRNGKVIMPEQSIPAIKFDNPDNEDCEGEQDKAWTIGQEWDGLGASDHLDGRIDELRIYDRVLELHEIEALAESSVLEETE
ncbi:MAG: hypothetical protein GY699_00490 [Desulfobacteraceae bacterium]|nr:hypothetical protein [Desulfobacteraceae bacterium]